MRVPVLGGNGRGRCLIQDVKILLGDSGGRLPSGPAERFDGGGWPRRKTSSAKLWLATASDVRSSRFEGNVHDPACPQAGM